MFIFSAWLTLKIKITKYYYFNSPHLQTVIYIQIKNIHG